MQLPDNFYRLTKGWRLLFSGCLLFLNVNNCSYAQINKEAQVNNPLFRSYSIPADTIIPRKKFFGASTELLVTELAPWSFNRFIRQAEFAKISWNSLKYNLKPSHWEWDDNKFMNNQFSHPYHGNLYFNTFRSNGYNFWQSVPAPFIGSLLWELAAETHPPAQNDFFNTSLGGIVLGEMTYRLANKLINPRQRGVKRQMQEVFALLLNPANGVTRITDGRWGKVRYSVEDTVNIPLSGSLDIGGRRFSKEIKDVIERGANEFYMRLSLHYGNPYEASKTPFSTFSVLAELGSAQSGLLNALVVNAALAQWVKKQNPNKISLYSISMNYDYYHNNSFEYGAQSFSFDIISIWDLQKKTKFFSKLGAGVIPIAAVPDDYLFYGEGRDYDYGPGFGINGDVGLSRKKFSAALYYRGGWFTTINGNQSHFFLNTASSRFRFNINPNVYLALETGHFSLSGYYREYDNVIKQYPFVRTSIGFTLFDR